MLLLFYLFLLNAFFINHIICKCRSKTYSELMKKNDFQGQELQGQTTVQSILQKLRPIKPKGEEIEKSDG